MTRVSLPGSIWITKEGLALGGVGVGLGVGLGVGSGPPPVVPLPVSVICAPPQAVATAARPARRVVLKVFANIVLPLFPMGSDSLGAFIANSMPARCRTLP